LATAVQESKLRNLDYGDSDSVGLFQQRPSQGWGSKEQILVPTYAAGKFFDALVKVPGWQTLPVARAAQAVQHSAFPDAYGSWEPRATALSAALTGQTTGQLSCRLAHPGLVAGQSASGASASGASVSTATTLAAASAAVTSDLRADLDITSPAVAPLDAKRLTISLSGLAASGTDTGSSTGSRSGTDGSAEHRDATVAAWAVAHAASHGVTSVVIGNQEWRPDRDGWHTAKHPAAAGVVVLTIGVR
jgi:hypothetical protein